MKIELVNLYKEYIEALNEHQQSDSNHRDGWVKHVPDLPGFIHWLDKDFIEC